VSQGRAARAFRAARLVWPGWYGSGRCRAPAPPADPSRCRAAVPVEPPQQGDEVAGALGPAGDDDQLAPGVVERAEQRAPPRPPRRFHPQVGAACRPAVGQVGVGQRLGLVPGQEVYVARRGLLLLWPEPQAGAGDGVRILPSLERVPRPAPAVAPLRRTRLRWPGEIVSSVRAAPSAASRARVQTGRSAAGPLRTSRATASAASRLRGVRPGRGRDRNAATPPERTAARQRRTCSARPPAGPRSLDWPRRRATTARPAPGPPRHAPPSG
jgi:hypothetical protein